MKQTILALTLAATTFSALQTANACSRLIKDAGETHGITIARSYDWGGSELQSAAVVHPVGVELSSIDTPEYKNTANWVSKHHAVMFMEVETFHNSIGEGVNDAGLSASLLYQDPSKEFIANADDNGAPALGVGNVVEYILTSYASVEDAVKGFEAGDFQVAWKTGIGGHQHGFHFSVQDKTGDIALFQLNEGGKMVVHRGDATTDLAVMANMPLRQDILKHAEKFDLDNANSLPSDISSPSRYLRGYHAVNNIDLDGSKDWIDVRGKMKGLFDFGNKVPQDLVDPTNGITYATWETFVYNLNAKDITYYNEGNATQMDIKWTDHASFTQSMCADVYNQSRNGEELNFVSCK